MSSYLIRSFLIFLSLGAIMISANPTMAHSGPFQQLNSTLNPQVLDMLKVAHKVAIPQLAIMTNAKRFSAGLPPLSPRRRATGTKSARVASASTRPGTQAYIEVREVGTNRSLGFIGNRHNSFGEAGVSEDTDPSTQMIFLVPQNGGPSNIQTINGPDASYPFFGGIKGWTSPNDLIGPSYSDYGYIGSTLETFPSSSPVVAGNTFTDATGYPEAIESAIWYHDTVTGSLTAQWVNGDGTMPTTYLGFIQGFFIFTGDQTAFADTYGRPTWVEFTVVPLVSS